MIPVMILFGLVAGRWWRTALVAGAVGWSVLLLATGVIGVADVPGAMLFGLANTAVGVGVHQGLLQMSRGLARARPVHREPSADGSPTVPEVPGPAASA